MKTLQQLLHSSDEDLLETAADLLGNVVSQKEHRCHEDAITAGVISVLTEHLCSRNGRLRLAAARGLSFLFETHPEAIGRDLLHLAATVIVALLDSTDKDTR